MTLGMQSLPSFNGCDETGHSVGFSKFIVASLKSLAFSTVFPHSGNSDPDPSALVVGFSGTRFLGLPVKRCVHGDLQIIFIWRVERRFCL
jgi:hypothetical protein